MCGVDCQIPYHGFFHLLLLWENILPHFLQQLASENKAVVYIIKGKKEKAFPQEPILW